MEKNKNEKGTAMHKVLSAIGLLLCVVFGFTFLCNMIIIVKGIVAPEKPPSVFGLTPMVVLSGSMSGTAEDHIEVGDLIFVDQAEPDQLQIGDVIAFMEGNIVVTHRIIDIETSAAGQRLFHTKGDANNTADEHPVSESNLVGIYKSRIPKVGDFAMFLQSPVGMVLFIGVPVIAFISVDFVRNRRSKQQEQEKTRELEEEVERLRKLTQHQNGGADET